MTRTIFLSLIALAVILIQLVPTHASTIKWATIVLAVVYLVGRAILTYPKMYRDSRRRAAQRVADARDFRRYEIELDEIHAKYEDNDAVIDTRAQAFQDDLTALHEKYRDTLERKFGRGAARPAKSYRR